MSNDTKTMPGTSANTAAAPNNTTAPATKEPVLRLKEIPLDAFCRAVARETIRGYVGSNYNYGEGNPATNEIFFRAVAKVRVFMITLMDRAHTEIKDAPVESAAPVESTALVAPTAPVTPSQAIKCLVEDCDSPVTSWVTDGSFRSCKDHIDQVCKMRYPNNKKAENFVGVTRPPLS